MAPRRRRSAARATNAAPSAAAVPGKRRRSANDEGAADSPKRSDRGASGRVHFGPRLESGPTPGFVDHRGASPARPAINPRYRETHDDVEVEDDSGNNDEVQHDDETNDSRDSGEGGIGGSMSAGHARQEGRRSMPSRAAELTGRNTGLELDVDRIDLKAQKQTQNGPSATTRSPSRDSRQTEPTNTIKPITVPTIVEHKRDELLSSSPKEYIVLSSVPDVTEVDSTQDKDLVVASRFAQIAAATKALAEAFPDDILADEFGARDDFKHRLLGPKGHSRLIRYIGCLALGGPKGLVSWLQLLRDPQTRIALVMGIIGRALKEHVFSDLWFGGETAEQKELEKVDHSLDGDGFSRTKERARKCTKFQSSYEKKPNAKIELQKAIVKVTLQLEDLLLPLFNARAIAHGDSYQRHTHLPENHRKVLLAIVEQAALLSRFIRQIDDVVYYWPPTFKDEEFDPARMECLNLEGMISKSPYTKDRTEKGYERAKLNEGQESRSEAIVRVVAFPGIVAYRQGGGALAKKTLDTERRSWRRDPPDVQTQKRESFNREGTNEHSGFRTKLIAKAVVHLEWGRQRLLTKEAGTSRHLDAMRDGSLSKYDRDYRGFVELYDVFRQYQRQHGGT